MPDRRLDCGDHRGPGPADAARLADLAGESDPRAYEEVVRVLRELEAPPPGLRRRVLARVHQEMRRVRRRRVVGLAGVAVAALAALALVALLPRGGISEATFIASDPASGMVFAARPGTAGALLDPRSLRPRNFETGDMPDFPPRITAAAFGPDGYIYVASPDDGTVRVLDSKGMRGERILPVGGRPTGLALSAFGELFVRDAAAGRVRVVDPATGATLDSMATGRPGPAGAPPGVVIASGDKMLLWVVDPVGARVVCYGAAHQEVAAHELEGVPSAAALSGDERFLVVADAIRPYLTVIDLTTLQTTWRIDLEHPAVAMTGGGGGMVYALESGRSVVSIDAGTGRIVGRYQLSAEATALTWTGDRLLLTLPDRVLSLPPNRLGGSRATLLPGVAAR